ncbi:MAG: SusC/RagA family TonB-linked outer membrane protein [Bacteroidales bacterium]|nr:SusC/RagA family TonB-linked outer membrane protein [Bacteroidales bacterium]
MFKQLIKKCCLTVALVMSLSLGLSAQNITVKGKVSDANGEPIIGAAVIIKGSKTGTSTDLDGKYSISVSRDGTLQFTALGYEDQEVAVKGRASINVVLSDNAERLSEATVTAEFGMKRVARSVGSAIQSVKATDITEAGRESFVNALQGKVAGMTITSTGGAPGASTSVVLRSATSISQSNQPLYVVDGVPINNSTMNSSTDFAYDDAVSAYSMDFSSRGNDINPEDIESMTILKGAAAAALYGSDASNGAIIITTKKGSAGRGKVSYSNSFRWDKAYGLPEIQDVYANGAYGTTNYYYTSRYGAPYPTDMKLYNNMESILQTGFSQTHNVSVEGGTEKVTVRGAASYTGQTGIVKTTDYNRLNLTLSGRAEVTSWLNFDAKMEYINTGNTKSSKGLYGVLYRAARWPLNDNMANYITEEGMMSRPALYTDTDLLNPLFSLYKNVNHDDVDRFMGSFNVNITPTKHTFLRATYGMDFSVGEYKVYTHPYYGNPASSSYGLGDLNYSKPTYKDQSLDAIAGYNNNWGKFSFSAQAGYHQKENLQHIFSVYGSGFQVIDFYSISNCDPATIQSRTKTQTRRIQALSAQAEFGYNNMAFLTVRARNDWSSTLPKANNSYFYPAVEGSFVATELPFMKNRTGISYLKLRGAIAQVGKDASPLSIYPSLEATEDYGGGFRYGYTGPNEALKPEMTSSWEVGFEGRFLNDRINTDFTYFWTKCENQYITGFRLSYATGFVLNNMNVGTFTTNGWEFHIDGDILRLNNGLRWNVGLNLSHSTSNVTELPANVTEYYNAYTWLSGNLRNGISVGNPITTMTGQGYLRNDNGDILIDPNSGLPLVSSAWSVLGDRQPKLELGLTSTISFKGFRLGATFAGRTGATVVNGTMRDMMSTGSSWESVKLRQSEPVIFKGVLRDGKENSANPTPNTVAVDYGTWGSSIYTGCDEDWLEKNVNFLRLTELRLSYTVPSKWVQNTTHKFVSAANVWVKTSLLGQTIQVLMQLVTLTLLHLVDQVVQVLTFGVSQLLVDMHSV